jgi:hypothetical protein
LKGHGPHPTLSIHPDYVVYVRIGRQNIAYGIDEFGQFRRDIPFFKEAPHDRRTWVGEAQKLIVVSVLMPATNGELHTRDFNGNVPSLVFWNHGRRNNSLLRQFLHEILRETFAP